MITAVGAVVVDVGARCLLVQRRRAPLAGRWTLPGGRVEPEEALEAAVVREIREETSVLTRVVAALDVVTLRGEGFGYAIHEYLLQPVHGDAVPCAGDDAVDARWATAAEAESLGVGPEALAVIQKGIAEAIARGLLPAAASGQRALR